MVLYLNEEGDHHGQHDEGETKDVEEGQSHENLGGRQLVIGVRGVKVDEGIGQEGHHSHLREHKYTHAHMSTGENVFMDGEYDV